MAITFEMRGRERAGRRSGQVAGVADRARAFRSSAPAQPSGAGAAPCPAGAPPGASLRPTCIALNTELEDRPGSAQRRAVELTADDLTMKNPSYFGVNKDGGRYQVRAKRAVVEFNRSSADQAHRRRRRPHAKQQRRHQAQGQAWTVRQCQQASLSFIDGIEIDTSNGMTARLSRATITKKEHRVVSKEPVTASTPTGDVRSAGMNLKTDTQAGHLRRRGHRALGRPRRAGPWAGSVATRANRSTSTPIGSMSTTPPRRPGLPAASRPRRATRHSRSPELTVTYEGKAACATDRLPKPDEGRPLSRLVAQQRGRDHRGHRSARDERTGRFRRQGRDGVVRGQGGQPGPATCSMGAGCSSTGRRARAASMRPPRVRRRRAHYRDFLPERRPRRGRPSPRRSDRGGRCRAGTCSDPSRPTPTRRSTSRPTPSM